MSKTPTNPLDTYPSVAYVKGEANEVLDANGSHARLQLVIGLVMTLLLGLALPLMLDGLWLVAVLLGGQVGTWVYVVYQVLLYGSLVFVTIPLCMGVYAMAVQMVRGRHELDPRTLMSAKVSVSVCLTPFTSAKAYGRALVAGWQVVGRWLSCVLLPAGFVCLADLWMPTLEAELSSSAYGVMVWLHGLLAVVLCGGAFLVACKYKGYAYLVFAHPQCSLKEVGQIYRARKPKTGKNFAMTLRHVGRVILAALPVFVPLLFHTIPHLLLSSAVYGECLFDPHQDTAV